MKRWHFTAVLAFSLSLGALSSSAQVTTGTPPMGTLSGGPDVIDLANLNAHLSIPVVHKRGRGIPFYYDLTYDSSVWYPTTSGSTTSWQPVSTWGWGDQTSGAVGHVTYSSLTVLCFTSGVPTGTRLNFTNWNYFDPQGTLHHFYGTVEIESGSCGSIQRGFTSTATDGSGYALTATTSLTATVKTRDGTVIVPPVNQSTGTGTITDRNGNQISASSGEVFTDTLGDTVLTVAGSGTPSSPTTYTYTGPSGATAYTVKYTNYTVKTNFGCSGVAEYGPTTVALVSEIDLPDQGTVSPHKYTFSYEPTPGFSGDVTGRVVSVTLPTGGTITYAYSGGSNGIVCTDGTTATLKRTVTPGHAQPAGIWTYVHSENGTAWTTTVTDPASKQTVMDFQGLYETDRKTYNGTATGTPLEEVQTCYNGATRPCTGTSITFPITQRSVFTSFPTGSSWLVSERNFQYNSFGSVTEEDDYDYGTNNPGGLLRKTLIQYASLGNNIQDKPSSVTVKNSSGSIVAQTTFSYDQTAVVGTSGTPQHVSVSGSRGNPTTVSYLTSGSNTLTRTYTYFDTGNMDKATDVNGAQTSYTYGNCGNSLLTKISFPIGLDETMAWNCDGAVVTSSTDQAGEPTTVTYSDPNFWRPKVFMDPLGNQKSYSYYPDSAYPTVQAVTWSLIFNSGKSQASDLQYEDGLGRTFVDQRKESPSSSILDSTSYTYDANGRPASASVPCAIGYSGTCSTPKTTYTYDALNRPLQVTDGGAGYTSYSYTDNDVYVTAGPAPAGENTKRRQLQYDGLGRLTSVCEITALTGSGSCGQTSAQTGYWTKYSYDALGDLTSVIQNAQSGNTQTRSYSFDHLGRMTSETEPESGTTTYVYDSDSTCGTYKGDLVKTVDAVGNVACYAYDSMHRLTKVTYSGSYASRTPNRYFDYDAATVDGVAMANAKGRLAEAYTATCQTCSKITDLGFSYDGDGRVTEVFESTPHSGGYYAVTANYFANGALDVLNGLPGLPKITYNVDGEGRPSTVSAGSGQNPVTATSYNPASQPLAVNFGSGDSDSYRYDPNTDRMTQYQFEVNGQSVLGNMIWNANGTLDAFGTADPFYSGNSQNCAYAHDDLARISNAQCGTDQLSNPSFEQGSTGWYFHTGTQLISGDPAGAHSGSNYVDISTSASATVQSTQLVAVSPGDEITFGGWAYRISGTTGYARWKLVALDANQNPVAYPGGDNATTASWTYQVGSYTVPSGVAYVKLYVEVYAATAPAEAKFDDGFLEVGSSLSETYTYDAFGNIEKSGDMSFMPAYSWTSNHITSIGSFTASYDADGNVLNDGLNTFAWDANGRPTTADSVTLTYDALGRMVEQDKSGAYTEIVYGPTGSKLALMNGQSLKQAFVPLPAGATAVYNSSGLEYYRHADWLGSARLTSTPSRTVSGDVAYAPFGETYAASGSPVASFTGQNADTDANLYDFMYREYGIQGRWPSPDPLGPGAFNLANPQSLNRYAYVLNNPTGLVDPLGLVNIPGYRSLVEAYGALGGGVQFGGTWNEFDLLGTYLYSQNQYVNGDWEGGVTVGTGIDIIDFLQSLGAALPSGLLSNPPSNPLSNLPINLKPGGGKVVNCLVQALQAAGVSAESINSIGAHNGHGNSIVVVNSGGWGTLGGFGGEPGLITQYTGFFGPGARIPVSIGAWIWGWHIEPVAGYPNEFQTHFDMGDPNRDVLGSLVHAIGDFLGGLFFHHHDPGLDPGCSPT